MYQAVFLNGCKAKIQYNLHSKDTRNCKSMLHTHCAKVDALNCMGGFLYLAFAVKRSSGNSLNTTVYCIITVVDGGVMCLFQTTLG